MRKRRGRILSALGHPTILAFLIFSVSWSLFLLFSQHSSYVNLFCLYFSRIEPNLCFGENLSSINKSLYTQETQGSKMSQNSHIEKLTVGKNKGLWNWGSIWTPNVKIFQKTHEKKHNTWDLPSCVSNQEKNHETPLLTHWHKQLAHFKHTLQLLFTGLMAITSCNTFSMKYTQQ